MQHKLIHLSSTSGLLIFCLFSEQPRGSQNYNNSILPFIKQEKECGRKMSLCSAVIRMTSCLLSSVSICSTDMVHGASAHSFTCLENSMLETRSCSFFPVWKYSFSPTRDVSRYNILLSFGVNYQFFHKMCSENFATFRLWDNEKVLSCVGTGKKSSIIKLDKLWRRLNHKAVKSVLQFRAKKDTQNMSFLQCALTSYIFLQYMVEKVDSLGICTLYCMDTKTTAWTSPKYQSYLAFPIHLVDDESYMVTTFFNNLPKTEGSAFFCFIEITAISMLAMVNVLSALTEDWNWDLNSSSLSSDAWKQAVTGQK